MKKLILDHKDNIRITHKDFEDSARINFHFPGKTAYFGSLIPQIKQSPDKSTRYVLWINKEKKLPYKLIGSNPPVKSSTACSDIKINDEKKQNFDATQKIPDDFAIKSEAEVVKKKAKTVKKQLRWEIAPYWKLKSCSGDSVALDDIKSKVILLNFTGMYCGPCHKAIPFLRNLENDYRNKNFELVSIETQEANIKEIKKFMKKNKINYKYFISNKKVKHKYNVQGVPTFFIIDKEREIKNIFIGYKKGSTDKKITSILNEMILQ
ncbi:MAG: TlpA family protein disulfide reductase [Bacteroidales bacterium]|nr:TlpA family protein disulfide reductase [Bacteroidales bacterium]MCF8336437.1 TlpA family protein disulfide reductase [Bacteroidales bacterium]